MNDLQVIVDSQGYIYYPLFIWNQAYAKRDAIKITDRIVFKAITKENPQ